MGGRGADGVMVGAEKLADDLARLGVRGGVPLMVHASMRRLGPVEGGAEAVLDTLLALLGPEGTLLMALGADDALPFDALSSPVDPGMGILAEVFRKRAGTRVNDHAAARFGAFGPRAAELLEPVPLHDYHGTGSVLERFTQMGGAVLRLGADLDTVTLTHWAEYLADVPNKLRVRRCYVRADTGAQWIEGLDDNDGIVDWDGGEYFQQILVDFLAAGLARTGQVGNCQAELLESQRFVVFAAQWLEARL